MWVKSIMKPHQMSFAHTLRPVVLLTVSQSWLIKLLANRKGTLIFSIYMRKVRITYIMVTIHRFAYVEFVDKESVDNALKLDDTPFKGRQLKVLPKRQNLPQSFIRGGGRGGRGRGGGRFRGRGNINTTLLLLIYTCCPIHL